jgi:hypothetical protein
MSVETLSEPEMEMEPNDAPETRYQGESNEFQYRPLSSLAVSSLVLGILSLIGIFLWIVLPVSVLALALGVLALVSIRKWQGEYTGSGVAFAGILFSLVSMSAGAYVQVNAYRHEVPSGFDRISFIRDISEKQFVTGRKGTQVNPEVEALVGKKIFFKGFVYPTDQQTELTSFLILKDSDQCCFGGKPKLTDMVGCVMADGKTCNYLAGRVSVAGTFKLNPKYTGQELDPIYMLDCEIMERSKSDF